MKKVLTTLIILMSFLGLKAQEEWLKTYGGTGNDGANDMIMTSDGGFILAGFTESFGAGGRDVFLVKTDSNGNMIWQKTYGGISDDYARTVRQTKDGGFIIGGSTKSFGYTNGAAYLIKTNAIGDTLWTRKYDNTFSEDIGYYVQEVNNGFVFTSMQPLLYYTTGSNDFLIRIDSIGSIKSSEVIGSTTIVKMGGYWANRSGIAIELLTDSSYMLLGYSHRMGMQEYITLRTIGSPNAYGEYVNYSYATHSVGYLFCKLDSQYYVTGYNEPSYTSPKNLLLSRVDTINNNDISDTTLFGGLQDEVGYSIKNSNGNLIMSGLTESYGAGGKDVYFLKTDTGGNLIKSQTFGGIGDEEACSIEQTSDGEYVMGGYTNSYGSGNFDMLLIKTNFYECSDATFIQSKDTVDLNNGGIVSFSNTDSRATSWHWDFGDGDTSILQVPTHTYNFIGNYTVTLITSNSICTDTFASIITVINTIDSCALFGPDASFIQSRDTVDINKGGVVSFFNDDSIATSWLWNFGDGDTSILQAANHTYNFIGNYTVTLITSNNICTDTFTSIITVINNIHSSILQVSTYSTCKLVDTILFTDIPSGISPSCPYANSMGRDYYAFSSYITGITLEVFITHGYADSTITDQNGNYINSTDTLPLPNSSGNWDYSFYLPSGAAAEGIMMQLHAIGTPLIAGETFPCDFYMGYIFDACSNYGWYMSDYDSCIVTQGLLNATFTQSTDTVDLNSGGIASFTNSDTLATSWRWNFGDGATDSVQSPTHQYDLTGIHIVTLIASNSICTDTFTSIITVINTIDSCSLFGHDATFTQSTDTVDLSGEGIVNFSNTDSLSTSWRWEFGDGGTDSIQNPIHIYDSTGTYIVSLIAYNGLCADTAYDTIVVINTTAVYEVPSPLTSRVKVFPNPFTIATTITIHNFTRSEDEEPLQFMLSDILGREVKNIPLPPFNKGDSKVELGRGDLPAGMYFYKLTVGKAIISSGKLVIE